METHTVYLYQAQIEQQCLRLFGSLDGLEHYAMAVCAHELGHAEDGELAALACKLDEEISEREQACIALRIEENAWHYAQQLLPELDPAFLHAIMEESLFHYRIRLEPATA